MNSEFKSWDTHLSKPPPPGTALGPLNALEGQSGRAVHILGFGLDPHGAGEEGPGKPALLCDLDSLPRSRKPCFFVFLVSLK